jgi:hypothetical protein
MNFNLDDAGNEFLAYEDGSLLTEDDVCKIDENLQAVPNSIFERLKLLRYYSEATEPLTVSNWLRHYKWMLESHPEKWITANLIVPNLSESETESVLPAWAGQANEKCNVAIINGRAGQFSRFDLKPAVKHFQNAEELDGKIHSGPRNYQAAISFLRNQKVHIAVTLPWL